MNVQYKYEPGYSHMDNISHISFSKNFQKCFSTEDPLSLEEAQELDHKINIYLCSDNISMISEGVNTIIDKLTIKFDSVRDHLYQKYPQLFSHVLKFLSSDNYEIISLGLRLGYFLVRYMSYYDDYIRENHDRFFERILFILNPKNKFDDESMSTALLLISELFPRNPEQICDYELENGILDAIQPFLLPESSLNEEASSTILSIVKLKKIKPKFFKNIFNLGNLILNSPNTTLKFYGLDLIRTLSDEFSEMREEIAHKFAYIWADTIHSSLTERRSLLESLATLEEFCGFDDSIFTIFLETKLIPLLQDLIQEVQKDGGMSDPEIIFSISMTSKQWIIHSQIEEVRLQIFPVIRLINFSLLLTMIQMTKKTEIIHLLQCIATTFEPDQVFAVISPDVLSLIAEMFDGSAPESNTTKYSLQALLAIIRKSRVLSNYSLILSILSESDFYSNVQEGLECSDPIIFASVQELMSLLPKPPN